MPITDVVLSSSAPRGGNYQVIDTNLNLALMTPQELKNSRDNNRTTGG
jgi:hypothetical protein